MCLTFLFGRTDLISRISWNVCFLDTERCTIPNIRSNFYRHSTSFRKGGVYSRDTNTTFCYYWSLVNWINWHGNPAFGGECTTCAGSSYTRSKRISGKTLARHVRVHLKRYQTTLLSVLCPFTLQFSLWPCQHLVYNSSPDEKVPHLFGPKTPQSSSAGHVGSSATGSAAILGKRQSRTIGELTDR